MKSMSWLLFEKDERSFLRECPACGFSTCSPSIYRRHSRRCDASNSAEENTDNLALVKTVYNIPSKTSAHIPDVRSVPSVDFPSISSEPTADFSDVSCPSSAVDSQTLVTDEPYVSKESTDIANIISSSSPSMDFPSISSEMMADFSDVSCPSSLMGSETLVIDKPHLCELSNDQFDQTRDCDGLDEGELPMKTLSFELQQLRREMMSRACDDVDSASLTAESLANSCLASEAAEVVAMPTEDYCDAVDSVLNVNAQFSVCDDSDTPTLDQQNSSESAVNAATDSTVLRAGESHSTSTEDICDEVKADNSLVNSAETNTESGILAVENAATVDESFMDTLPSMMSEKSEQIVKKSARSRKSSPPSKQRLCKHCNCVLPSQLDRRTHMHSKHPDKIPIYRCADCNYCSVEHKNYERHLLRHLLSGPFRCDQCSFSSTSQSSIKRHLALQHSNMAADNVASLEIPPKVAAEIPLEVSATRLHQPVDSSESQDSACDSSYSDANRCEKQESCDLTDSVGSTSHGRGNNVEADNTETKADGSCMMVEGEADTAGSKDVIQSDRKDMIQSVIEVEVRNYWCEDTGEMEAWWTCLTCGCRYNQRAKVRRHVKCKHQVALTQCHLRDLRLTSDLHVTPANHTAANDSSTKLQEPTAEPSSNIHQHLSTVEPQNVNSSTPANSVGLSSVKFEPKSSFVKIAPKPVLLESGVSQALTTPRPTISNHRRQVVLPKCNWKQMSFCLKPSANIPPETTASASGDVNEGDAESELKRHLTAQQHGSPADNLEKQPENIVISPASVDDVPRKKQRLILHARLKKPRPEPSSSMNRSESHDSTMTESLDSSKHTSLAMSCSGTVPCEHGHSHDDDSTECSSKVEDTATGEPLDRVSQSNDEEMKKLSEMKRSFGIKRTSALKCAHCQFTAFRLPDLRRHLLEHTGDTVYECGRCSRSFRNKIGLYLHDQRKHQTDQSATSLTDKTGPTVEDSEQAAAETATLEKVADGMMMKKKSSQKKSLISKSKPVLGDPADPESTPLTGDQQGESSSDCHNLADVERKDRKKRERQASKRCTETVEMVQSTGTESDHHFKIVIRRQSSVGEEILETIDGVNDGMMCRYCCYVAKIPVQLTQHMKIHTGQRDYWCTIGDCTYKTIWRCDMKKHFMKFHPDEVERHEGNYYDLLQLCYRPCKSTDKTDDSTLCVESSSTTRVNVFKLSKRHRRRLMKLKNQQHCAEETPPENESEEAANSVTKSSSVKLASEAIDDICHMSDAPASSVHSDTKKPPSDTEAKKNSYQVKLTKERFRPYKCSECGRRSNWRWDLKKHVEAMHSKAAVIIKLNEDVARATFADIYSSQGGRNGIRLPRHHDSANSSPKNGKVDGEVKCSTENSNSQDDEPVADSDSKKPMPELEKTLARAPAPVKSIGMIDKLQLKRFQCSDCLYRSNHRGDLRRHIRMRHGRSNCTINVLNADVAATTLHAYRYQWNRKKARLPTADSHATNTGRDNTQEKFSHSKKEEAEKTPAEDEDAEKIGADSGSVDDGSGRKQHHKDFWYFDEGDDETKCCDMCPFKTDRTGLLELHKLRHRAPAASNSSGSVAAAFSCPHCPYFVRTARQLERHMALHEESAIQPNHEPLIDIRHIPHCGPAKNRYVCEKCPFVSKIRNEFWLHRRHHFVPKVDAPYTCSFCSFWATDRRTMSEHSFLHSQSFYPRLSVPVISRYRSAAVKDRVDAADEEVYSGKVMMNSGCEVATETVEDSVQSKKMVSCIEETMEVEDCPHLEAMDEIVAAADADVQDCCPLLECECLPSTLEPAADSQESPVESADSLEPILVKLEPAVTQESLLEPVDLQESVVVKTEPADTPESIVVSMEPENPSEFDTVKLEPAEPQESILCRPRCTETAPCCAQGGNSVTCSDADTDIAAADGGMSRGLLDVSPLTDLETEVLNTYPLPAAESVVLVPSSGDMVRSQTNDVSAADKRDALEDEAEDGGLLMANLLTTTSSHQTVSASAAVHLSDDSRQAREADGVCDDIVQKTNCDTVESGMVVPDHFGKDQTVADSGSGRSSVKVEYRVDDDVLKSSCDISARGLVVADHSDSGKDDVPEGPSADNSISVKEECRRSDESGTDDNADYCSCGLQCPYCFFAIASVRLLRQHMVFHVAMSDAVRTPVFSSRLDNVDDGRMDDELIDERMVQLCRRCRRIASQLASPDDGRSAESLTSCSCLSGISDSDLLSSDKSAFLSELSLCSVR